jgi:CRISPR-associated protein Csm1
MNFYLSYFLHGLRKYCGQFPNGNDLPVFLQQLPEVDNSVWENALRLNYGKSIAKVYAVPLCSVFESLRTGKAESLPFAYRPLSISADSIFPKAESGSFQDLVSDFANELKNLKKLQPEDFTDSLVFLSKKYFSNAGFSAELPHISLNEHLKTTAALADCLERSENRKILLAGAGLDNIQGFCYDIVSSKAAKSLKGRSFFLQMLLDTISSEIIGHPQILASKGHIVYSRGGKVFLLLPDSPTVRDALSSIKKELNENIWQRYRSSLFMFLKFESFDEHEIDLSNVWKRLQAKIRADKQQKNIEMLTSDFNKFFDPIAEGFQTGDLVKGSKQFCRVTGELIDGANRKLHDIEADQNEDPIWVLESVKFQSELGEALRETREYIQWQGKAADPIFTGSKSILTVPEEGDWSLRYAQPFEKDFNARFRWKLNETDFLPDSPNGTGYGFAFYGGNEQALHKDGHRIKFFSELAGLENMDDSGEGFTRLGIGRMDVDGLGKMAEKAESSFALNATFSAHLDLFLSGYINTLRASRPEFVDFLNIVFSGGDDMLIVGRWDLTLDFLAQLRKDFSKFQGGNFLTMSAGLVLVTPKFPIAKAVQMAGYAEDRAKDFPGKNALCFMGEVVSWEGEFQFVHYFSEKLREWLTDPNTGISMSLIFKIYRFYEMQRDERPDWRWLSAWFFQQCEKENKKSKAIFYALKIFVISGIWKLDGDLEYRFSANRALMLLSLAGRIADFKNRMEKN